MKTDFALAKHARVDEPRQWVISTVARGRFDVASFAFEKGSPCLAPSPVLMETTVPHRDDRVLLSRGRGVNSGERSVYVRRARRLYETSTAAMCDVVLVCSGERCVDVDVALCCLRSTTRITSGLHVP